MSFWIEWSGGSQPVDDDTAVEVFLREGSHLEREAVVLRWTHDGGKGDVVEYRALYGSTHEIEVMK